MAIHHLELAQQFPSESEEQRESYVELKSQIRKSKDREMNLFQRLSPEIFTSISSFFEAPDLTSVYAVNKSWRNSIFETTELFQHFKMDGGDVHKIVRGLKLFRERSKNSIKSIELRVTKAIEASHSRLLQETILASSQTLLNLTIFHQGDLCGLIINTAAECPHLKYLSSRSMEGRFDESTWQSMVELPKSFKPKLLEFEWDAGSDSLFCDAALINSLQEATKVTICSVAITMDWVVELLSSASNLVKLELPYLEKEAIEDKVIPFEVPLYLPHLTDLWLDRPPTSEIGDSSQFFKNLHVPRLEVLQVNHLEPKGLLHLKPESRPKELTFDTFFRASDDLETEEEDVCLLVESIKGWKSLEKLDTELQPDTFHRLMELLTPTTLSDQVALPSLKNIVLQMQDTHDPLAPSVYGKGLVAFVKARLKQSEGVLEENVASAPEDSAVRDQVDQSYAVIEELDIVPTVILDNEDSVWLEANVKSLKLREKFLVGEC